MLYVIKPVWGSAVPVYGIKGFWAHFFTTAAILEADFPEAAYS